MDKTRQETFFVRIESDGEPMGRVFVRETEIRGEKSAVIGVSTFTDDHQYTPTTEIEFTDAAQIDQLIALLQSARKLLVD